MTLGEWIDAHPTSSLRGVVVQVPMPRLTRDMQPRMAIRSAWPMGATPGSWGPIVGVWLGFPDNKSERIFPVTNVPIKELRSWDVVE